MLSVVILDCSTLDPSSLMVILGHGDVTFQMVQGQYVQTRVTSKMSKNFKRYSALFDCFPSRSYRNVQ